MASRKKAPNKATPRANQPSGSNPSNAVPAKRKTSAATKQDRTSQPTKKRAQSPAARNKPAHRAAAHHEIVPIVGIGASAGGLEAFTQLLAALPADTGMAFVLVSHLSHSHKSFLTELLARTTSMPVTQIQKRTRVQPNHVYVIPPNMDLAVSDGGLRLTPLPKGRRPPMTIDVFLRSVAEHRKSRAIGVILSGTGTDGTLGLAAIKAEGGITFVQDEKSAKYPDMSHSAQMAGSADFVLPPDRIAAELARIARHPYVADTKGVKETEELAPPADDLAQVFSLIRNHTGVDFSSYKPTTIRRRILRRMVLHKLDDLKQYVPFVRANAKELDALYNDLLINVTGFFRDSDTFDYLQWTILPDIIASRSANLPVRVWVPGCASGEEAYSLAICLLEGMADFGAGPPVQIFATDVSEIAIKKAREGLYPEAIADYVSHERLRRFFAKTDEGYQISKAVRDLCVFAPQNVIKDPPFSRMDLISCRNVLIYLNGVLQRRVLTTFHYALNPGGILLLGASETAGAVTGLFEQVDKKHKVFTKTQTAARPQFELSSAPEMKLVVVAKRREAERHGVDVSKEADRIVLARYSPAGVVVNSALDIIQFRGQTIPYLEPSPGEASLNLFRMARQSLVVDLRAALHQAKKSGLPVRKEAQLRTEEDVRGINIEVIPLDADSKGSSSYLILFQEPANAAFDPAAAATTKGRALSKSAAARQMETLRNELAATQDDLNSIIEEQEAGYEELQSANEEILSANEELQSTNEELETAREELQATNEELATINEELQNRNVELTQSVNDVNNLIAASDVVMVMIGHDLRIRRITPGAQKALNLIAADVGRPLANIKTNLQLPNLETLISSVIDTATPISREVQDTYGHWYAMKIRPYRTEDNTIHGAVMVLVDIEAVKLSEESAGAWRSFVEPVPDFIVSVEPEGKILFVSRTTASLAKQADVGDNIFDHLDPHNHEALKHGIQKVLRTAESATFQTGPAAESSWATKIVPIKSKSDGAIFALTLITVGRAEEVNPNLTPASKRRSPQSPE